MTIRSEYLWEEGRIDPPQEEVAVCHGERSALAIAGRAGICARALWSDAEARSVETADRAAASRNSVDLHRRGRDAHPRDHFLRRKFVLAGIVAYIGAGPAHVEADQAFVAERFRGCDHADHATGGAGEDRVLPAKTAGIG